MITYVRLIVVAVVALGSSGCATTQWTRDKLEIAEDRLRALAIEQFAHYERKYQSSLSQLDQKTIELDTQLGLLREKIKQLEKSMTVQDGQLAALSAQHNQHRQASETKLTRVAASTDSLSRSVKELVHQVSVLNKDAYRLKNRWAIEAEEVYQWHGTLIHRLLDAIGRAVEEPTEDEKAANQVVVRFAALVRQMVIDMRTQLEVSRRKVHDVGRPDADVSKSGS